MTTAERIRAKLDQCRPYYDRLLELRLRLAERDVDWIVWDSVERNLQLAVQCAIDVGEMVISWKGFERAEENKDVFAILGRHKILDEPLAERMAEAAGLRNLLVHEYAPVDRDRLRAGMRDGLGDIEAFAQAIAGIL